MSKVKYKEDKIIYKLLNNKIVVFLSNFIFQGIRYMSFGEKIYKISITILFAFVFHFVIQNWIIDLFLGHLINYIFNGQFYVVYRYLTSNEVITKEKLLDFINEIESNIKFFKPFDVLIIGSFSRSKMSKTSDLDIRIYHDNNFVSSLKAYIMATKLRFLGLVKQFPIDVYCFSDMKFMDKIRKDEVPVNFLKNKEVLKKYPSSPNIKEHLKKLEFK